MLHCIFFQHARKSLIKRVPAEYRVFGPSCTSTVTATDVPGPMLPRSPLRAILHWEGHWDTAMLKSSATCPVLVIVRGCCTMLSYCISPSSMACGSRWNLPPIVIHCKDRGNFMQCSETFQSLSYQAILGLMRSQNCQMPQPLDALAHVSTGASILAGYGKGGQTDLAAPEAPDSGKLYRGPCSTSQIAIPNVRPTFA